MWKGAYPASFSKARDLGEKMTTHEMILWEILNNAPFGQFKFRRQHPFGHYILDFYSHKLKRSLEIDGSYHQEFEQKLHDKQRTDFIKFQGISELRFSNMEISDHLPDVIH